MKSKRILRCLIVVLFTALLFSCVQKENNIGQKQTTVVDTKKENKNNTPSLEDIENIKLKKSAKVDVIEMLQNPELPSGCEAVALTIALSHYGYNLSKTEIIDNYLPFGSSMVYTYAGSPYNAYYGGSCYAPAIKTAANKFLSEKKSEYRAYDITDSDFEYLLKCVTKGYPVVVWNSMYMLYPYEDGGSETYGGRTYNSYSYEHCVVLYGYDFDKNVVLISDPLEGYMERDLDTFKEYYDIMGQNAVLIK